MTRNLKDDDIVEHIINLRVQAVAAYELYQEINARIDFYRKYISLGETHNVRLAGSWVVIRGGRSIEKECSASSRKALDKRGSGT
jgi:hypothetical protein